MRKLRFCYLKPFAYFFIFLCLLGHATPIKVAVIDNFHTQKLPSDRYGEYYIQGIQAAQKQAEAAGIGVIYQFFSYGNDSLDVINALHMAVKWKPDVIIGPRSSNQLLLMRDKINNVMVISPYATADAIATLPNNFYSLVWTDDAAARAIANFVNKNFPGQNIYLLTQMDCKSCVGVSNNFVREYQKINTKSKIFTSQFIQDQAESVDLSNIFKNYKNGIVLLPNMSYPTAILMERITNYLNSNMIFVGGDDWGDWSAGMIGKIHANHHYIGYRITPYSIDDSNNSEAQIFKKLFLSMFHKSPDVTAYVSYHALNSILVALEKYPDYCKKAYNSECALKTYQHVMNQNKHFFKPDNYYVYQIDNTGEVYVNKIPTTK